MNLKNINFAQKKAKDFNILTRLYQYYALYILFLPIFWTLFYKFKVSKNKNLENKPYIILHEDASLLQDNMLILVGPDDSYEIPKTISINKFMETDEDTLSNITLINCLVSNVFNWHLNEVVNEKEHNFMLCNCDRYPENLCYIFNYNGIDFKGNFDPILLILL